MGENERNRATVEHMAAAIKTHEAQRGRYLTAGEAQSQAAKAARETDNKREAGALRNKRKRPTQQRVQESRRPSGKIFSDLGSKKK